MKRLRQRSQRHPTRTKVLTRGAGEVSTLELLVWAAVLALLGALAGRAGAAPATPEDAASRMAALEVKVWTADEQDLPAVEREIVREMQVNPRSVEAHQHLSKALVRIYSRDPSDLYLLRQASELAQQAIDLDPQSTRGYVALADILDLMGSTDRAVRLLDEAEAAGIRPDWRVYLARARLTTDSAKPAKTLALLETALGFTDAEPRIVAPYVVAILQSEASGEALVAKLTDWHARFPSPVFALTKAMTLSELGRYNDAHQVYAALSAGTPALREAVINDAIILYQHLGKAAKAGEILEGVLASGATELPPQLAATARVHLGAVYMRQKQYDRAGAVFLDASVRHHDNLNVLDFITQTYRQAGAHDELARLIGRINERVPGSGVLHALLGETLSESLARHDEAVRSFANAIILDPDRTDYYNGMGLALYRKKNYADALRLFTTAIEIDPNDATAHYNEACMLALLGRGDEALSSLAEALTLEPRLTTTARGDDDLASVRGSLKFRDLVERGPVDRQGPSSGRPAAGLGH